MTRAWQDDILCPIPNEIKEETDMKKILAMVLALAMVLCVAAAAAEYKTVEAGKFI